MRIIQPIPCKSDLNQFSQPRREAEEEEAEKFSDQRHSLIGFKSEPEAEEAEKFPKAEAKGEKREESEVEKELEAEEQNEVVGEKRIKKPAAGLRTPYMAPNPVRRTERTNTHPLVLNYLLYFGFLCKTGFSVS
ncbi:unnamed protein product [Arabis nemorensis]|uniref:Uncharacterized protein n=1 Tax=Arabis nemorensis TaxID=586526 RepID=A0A565CS95_9BRAS|nr:unnamed protein product [Arabis nemorensis]